MLSISKKKLPKPEELLRLHQNFRKILVEINSLATQLQTKIKNQNEIIITKNKGNDKNGAALALRFKKFYEKKVQNLEDKKSQIEEFLFAMESLSMGNYRWNESEDSDYDVAIQRKKTEEYCKDIGQITQEIGQPIALSGYIDDDKLLEELSAIEEQENSKRSSDEEVEEEL